MAASKPVKRADIRAFVGTTGSGKGVGINEHLAALKPKRLIVFDPLKEYGEMGQVVTSVQGVLTAMKKPNFKVIWQPDDETEYDKQPFKDDFALFCRGAFLVGELCMLVEELELVTRPTWAPAAWRNCTKRGRHKGLIIIAATQRPADADKAFWSSCSYIRCHALRETSDKDRMARVLDVPYEQINDLETIAVSQTKTSITYYERDFGKGLSGEKTIVLGR